MGCGSGCLRDGQRCRASVFQIVHQINLKRTSAASFSISGIIWVQQVHWTHTQIVIFPSKEAKQNKCLLWQCWDWDICPFDTRQSSCAVCRVLCSSPWPAFRRVYVHAAMLKSAFLRSAAASIHISQGRRVKTTGVTRMSKQRAQITSLQGKTHWINLVEPFCCVQSF